MGSAMQQWRLINVGALFVGYCLYFLNRKSFVFLVPEIVEAEGLQNSDLGVITSSLSLAYSFSKFVGGVMSDHVSPRVMFPIGLLITGVLSLQMSLSTSIQSFVFVSFLMGLAQGGAWPSVTKVLKEWYPPSEIGVWWSVVSSASNLAGTVGPLGLAMLALSFGWRGSMQFCASGAVIVAATAGFVIRSSPADVGLPPIQPLEGARKKDSDGSTTSESGSFMSGILAIITSPALWMISFLFLISNFLVNGVTDRGHRSMSTAPESFMSGILAIITSPALWVISFLFLISNFLVHGVTDWGQLFLIQEKGLSHATGSSFTSAYSLGGIIGSISSGYITDKLVAKYGLRSRGTPRYPWLLFMVALNLLSMHALRNYVHADSYHEVILLAGLGLGFSQWSCVTLFGVVTIENAAVHISGTAHAFAALAANIGGILAGFPLTYISQHYSWSYALYCMEFTSFLSLIVMLLMRKMHMGIGHQSLKKTR